LRITPGAYPRRKQLKGAPIGWLWPCPQILRPDWNGFPRKPSSLLDHAVSDEEKKVL
jgi:hypothetical protein